jgi:site-specific recombinase XerD
MSGASTRLVLTRDVSLVRVPTLFAPTKSAAKRFLEFFAANIRNPNTRRAYLRAVREFADWCAQNEFYELVDIEPIHVSAYMRRQLRGWTDCEIS